jgi:hypothetical protein
MERLWDADGTADPPASPAVAPQSLGRQVGTGIERSATERSGALITGIDALLLRDDGTPLDPEAPEDWDEWVSAGRTRNQCLDDPILDWLDRYGALHGFVRDDEMEGYDPRTDMRQFVLQRGQAFEDGVMRLIRERVGEAAVTTIRDLPEDTRSLAKARETFEAMRNGIPIIAQGVLRNPERRTYGAVDLLVRSDYLNALVPETLSAEDTLISAPALATPGGPPPPWHYRAVDVKFHTFELKKDGHVGSGNFPYHVQVWIYNDALGRLQGYLPPAGFLLGRSWTQGDKGRGVGCLDRLARVDQDRERKADGRSVAEIAEEALAWVRRLRVEGAGWQVLPQPSVPELYPHMRNIQDQPWHSAKARIAREIAELTLLPAMNPRLRRAAHARGIRRWDDPGANALDLGISPESHASKTDAVLAANRSSGPEVLFPDRVRHADQAWRDPVAHEFYVDFETVNNLDDDFTALPAVGGQALIFQIGCGRWEAGAWRFEQWTVGALSEAEEARIIDAWLEHMRSVAGSPDLDPATVRIFHWSPAESATLISAYNSAHARQPGRGWPVAMPWYDVLQTVIRAEPVTVRGAFNFGLKSIARAMRAGGLIETDWADSPLDGLGAMVGAFWCAREAAAAGIRMTDLDLMREIGRYNEVDCRTMAEIVRWLRANR